MNASQPVATSLLSCEPIASAVRVSARRAWRAFAALVCVFALAGNVAADTPAAVTFAGGNGTQADPFQISNLAELRKFMETPVLGFFPQNSYYKLTAHIEAADTSTWLGGLGWQPVDATLMDGFDPAGFEIRNLYVNRPGETGVGFFKIFGAFAGMTLDNFRLVGGQITGGDLVGGLAGSTGNGTTISNSISTAAIFGNSAVGGLVGYMGTGAIVSSVASGTVTATGDIVGGLVGNVGGASVTSSHAQGHVTGKVSVGGLAGVFTQGSGSGIASSWATGNVDGQARVGGLIGESTANVSLSFATGAVTATGVDPTLAGYAFAGGLIGRQDAHATDNNWASGAVSSALSGVGGLMGTNAGTITKSATIAGQTVSGGPGASSVGGLVGDNKGAITSSRAGGTVSASGSGVDSIGGLVGVNSTAAANITSSYATGNVTAANAARVGGLVGWHVTGTISGSHAHGNVMGADSTGGLLGLSTNSPVNTSFATGTVSGGAFVGGLIGNRGSGATDTTYATGDVTGTGDYVGGLIGFNSGSVTKSYAKSGTVGGATRVGGLIGNNQGTIDRSFAIKNVTGTSYVGGLAGQNASNSFGIRDCYATGGVTGSDKVGGLVGRNEAANNITRCYAWGTVTPTGVGSLGAVVGDNQSGGISSVYWESETAPVVAIGTGITGGTTGLNAVQIRQQASFAGFVFPSPWTIVESVSAPQLDYAVAGVGASTTSLASNANPSGFGQNVGFTATVTGNAPTGTVLFQDGANPINGCIAVTLTAGQAQCTIAGLSIGTHFITAVYSGDVLNTGSSSPAVNESVRPPSFDVDASSPGSEFDALTDGLLIVRYMRGLTGNALVAGALGQAAVRVDPVQIKAYLDYLGARLDIDGDGNIDAATDGVLIVRYLSGLRGAALIADAVALPAATRQSAADVEAWILGLLPP